MTKIKISPYRRPQKELEKLLEDNPDIDLVDIENFIVESSSPHDDLGGYYFPPTGTFRNNLLRDIRYALKSEEPEDIERLIHHFRRVQRRLQAKTIEDREPAKEQNNLKGWHSVIDLAKHYDVDSEALRKRLERHREKHALDANLFVESQDRGKYSVI